MKKLSPSLWRTCRALANRRRLEVFQSLLTNSDRTVSAVAETCSISTVSASQSLRTLNARGLLRVGRTGRWVAYHVGHDPAVPETAAILRALCSQLGEGGAGIEATFKELTAFTHPRRIRIVRALAKHGGLPFATLCGVTGISPPALCRHMRKLESRGAVRKRKGAYVCARPASPLLRTLMRLAIRRGQDSHT
jgi:predicted ArsR family transcriptional regulator